MWYQNLAGLLVFCFFVPADLDTDKLLKKDLVTLDEAVKTANNAVLLAITAVSVLKSVCLLLYYLFAFWSMIPSLNLVVTDKF